MSTGLNCYYIETVPDRWFYVLEDRGAPKDAWDWREYATAYGPFASEEAARTHLHRHHANPGGSNVYRYNPERTLKEVEVALLATAPANVAALRGG